MNNIHVVVDSTAQIPEAMLRRHPNLHKISLKIGIGETEWDEDDLSPGEMFEESRRTGVFQRTSQPPIGEFMRVFEEITASGGEVIVIAVSGALSGTVQGAKTAAESVAPGKIHVIDSQSAALGMLKMAETALEMIEEDFEISQILARLKDKVRATHTIILPDSLEHLHKGGRIGSAAKLIGTILQIKPILVLNEGLITVLDKVRTQKRAMKRMVEELDKCVSFEYIGVVHVTADEDAAQLKKLAQEVYPYANITVTAAGSAVGAHTGPKAVALIYQEKL